MQGIMVLSFMNHAASWELLRNYLNPSGGLGSTSTGRAATGRRGSPSGTTPEATAAAPARPATCVPLGRSASTSTSPCSSSARSTTSPSPDPRCRRTRDGRGRRRARCCQNSLEFSQSRLYQSPNVKIVNYSNLALGMGNL